MADPVPKRMTVEEFIPWAMARPETEHYELVAGEVVAMAPERLAHTRSKARIWRLLSEAIETRGLECEAFVDGVTIRVDAETAYEPDVAVRCGERLSDDMMAITDPLIVVEVRSPSTAYIDSSLKLADYVRLPSVRHDLMVNTEKRVVVHHERDAAGAISTKIIHDGVVRLDPPGIELAEIFEPLP
ncbi:MAG: Uma2 family endonuclease [Acetobacteraceae bacterium]